MLDVLARVDIFQGLPERAFEQLAAKGQLRTFPPGAALMRQGEDGQSIHVILSGRVCVERTVPGGEKPLFLAELGSGEAVGEMAVMENEPRSATVTAVDEVQTVELEGKEVAQLVSRYPRALENYLRVLRQRARQTQELGAGPRSASGQ